jgi:hypothetical protein
MGLHFKLATWLASLGWSWERWIEPHTCCKDVDNLAIPRLASTQLFKLTVMTRMPFVGQG